MLGNLFGPKCASRTKANGVVVFLRSWSVVVNSVQISRGGFCRLINTKGLETLVSQYWLAELRNLLSENKLHTQQW
jgi:hypothetical protein